MDMEPDTTSTLPSSNNAPGSESVSADLIASISEKAVMISDRNYLVNNYCVEKSVDMSDLFAKTRVYSDAVLELKKLGVMQYGVPIESRPGPTVTMEFAGEKRTMIMFASNDYLNLSTDPRIHDSVIRTLRDYGIGAGSSRVGTGYSYLHRELEEKLARHFGKEAAIVFPSGYDAVSSPIVTLATPKDRVVIDSASHACIVDGAHSSGGTVRFFSHNNTQRLDETLQKAREIDSKSGLLVVIEGAYSMDGDIAKLPEISRICKKHGARLMIDEAHSIGVHGKKGHGVAEHFGMSADVDLIAGTLLSLIHI